jgi:hypothetical protein
VGTGLVRLVIVAAVTVVIVAGAHSSVKTTSLLAGPAVRWTSTVRYDEQTCLQAAVRRSVRKGARVYLVTSRIIDKPIMIFEAELVAPWADPTTRANAQWSVSVNRGGNGCRGLEVDVHNT